MSKFSTFLGGAIVGSIAGPALTAMVAFKLSPTLRNVALEQTKTAIQSLTKKGLDRLLYSPEVRKDVVPTRRSFRAATPAEPIKIERIGGNEVLLLTNSLNDVLEMGSKLDFLVNAYGFFSMADLKTLIGQDTVAVDRQLGWTSRDQYSVDPDRFAITFEAPKAKTNP